MMKKYINNIIHEDALNFLSKLKDKSVDMVLTDPPSFPLRFNLKIALKFTKAVL